ncbi:MAG: hypothetical protein V9E95_05225 [Methanothrix soehngenii]
MEKTCNDLEEMGARGLILMRFANRRDQGLILGNGPIMPGIIPHTIEEFRDLVTHTAEMHSFRVTGTPLMGSGHRRALRSVQASRYHIPPAPSEERGEHHHQPGGCSFAHGHLQVRWREERK